MRDVKCYHTEHPVSLNTLQYVWKNKHDGAFDIILHNVKTINKIPEDCQSKYYSYSKQVQNYDIFY